MKSCNTCGEVFEDKFSFCPIDGAQLGNRINDDRTSAFNLTLIEEASLPRRLAMEMSFLLALLKQGWPRFKNDPVGFTKSKSSEIAAYLSGISRRPYARAGFATALALVAIVVLSVVLLDKRPPRSDEPSVTDDLYKVSIIDLSTDSKPDSGIGAGEEGRVGFNKGKGEGSNSAPARAQGGGGGGTRQPLPASQGRPPVASPIPAPITTTYARLPSLPAAGLDIDPALWRNLDLASYGDPRSKATTPSNGPGEGGGVGTGKGLGIGEGEDNGFGPGRKGNMGGDENSRGRGGPGGSPGINPANDPNRIYRPAEVTTRARVISKPEPHYTEAARKNGTTGTVILRVVFSSSGEVTNIQAMQKLGDGLTERAMAAAKQIRFVPAMRNGQPVSMYMQLEYNFNLY
ncbi:MAG TPA: energy transducer TonB [Pyrinomonadaceae bacterium]|nr:energy transducer TonB [Pyrinomonadaceae bacterium]